MPDETHPIDALFAELAKITDYPEGVVPVPSPQLTGNAFFPGGDGLWKADLAAPRPPMPRNGILVLGHDFGSEAYFDARKNGSETEFDPAQSNADPNATWRDLHRLLKLVPVNLSTCFFTNIYMGLRAGDAPMTGPFPGRKDKTFVQKCYDLFTFQLAQLQPKLILTLGKEVPPLLAQLAPADLRGWKKIQRFSEMDNKNTTGPLVRAVQFPGMSESICVVALVHPCMGNSNRIHRTYGEFNGEEAELAMIREGLKIAGLASTMGE